MVNPMSDSPLRAHSSARPAARSAARPVAAAAAVALLLAGTACGSKSSSSSSASAAASPTVKTTPLPADPSFKGTVAGAAADVTISKCGTDAGKQTASGTVTNSTKTARDYAIMVIWLRNGDGKPYGAALTTVKSVAPGKSVDWSATATVATKVDKCVKNVRAGTLGK